MYITLLSLFLSTGVLTPTTCLLDTRDRSEVANLPERLPDLTVENRNPDVFRVNDRCKDK